MKIFVGSDHAGFKYKEKIILHLKTLGYEVEDKGAFEYNEADDYPDFIIPVAQEVSKNPNEVRGIILGGSGQGEAMCANKFKNVRTAVYYGKDDSVIKLSREHNNANILSLGARFLTEEDALKAVADWLDAPFSGDERHVRRIAKINMINE